MVLSRSSLPASLLRQHAFCPRIPYYNEVMQLNPGDRLWQQQGVDLHQRQVMLDRRRGLSRYGVGEVIHHHNLALKSEALALHGICDALLESATKVYPVEFKMRAPRITRGMLLQLAAYGMMAEEQYGKAADIGFILVGDRGETKRCYLDAKAKEQVLLAIEQIGDHLSSPLLPASSASAYQCGQCEYLNFCADRE